MGKPKMLARLRARFQRDVSRLLATRPMRMHNSQPIVSFTFDDFPRSALLTGGRILAKRGWEGTFYTSFGLMEKVAPTGQIFSLKDLEFLGRHELGCHTFDHCDAWETPSADFDEAIT